MRVFFALVLTAMVFAAADTAAAPTDVVGAWRFVGKVTLADGEVVTVQGRLSIQAGGTMTLADDGIVARGLTRETQESLAQKGIRLLHGPSVGAWSVSRGVFAFRVTAFVYDTNDPLGRAIGSRTIEGIGVFDPRTATWEFENGYPIKWVGPEFDASKNEVSIESIEIAHEGFLPS